MDKRRIISIYSEKQVRKLSLCFLVLWLITGCRPTDNSGNPIVAEAFHNKLYLSEVMKKTPYFASKEDTLLFMDQYVEDWILRQTLLARARQKLTAGEQDFSSQIAQYKEQLLINAYLQKISKDSALFEVPTSELYDFINETKADHTPEYRDMVKLNYIRLSERSKIYNQVKKLFFEEPNRAKAMKQLEALCADTVEYYLDNARWFYADFIEKEFPFSFSDAGIKDKLDIVQDGYRYLILILDRKQQLQPRNTLEDRKIAQALLQQQKKAAFLSGYQDSLVRKAVMEKRVARYPVVF
ncbi:MAG: hypothetical protein FWD09_02165 [Lentimicrobiaceae bacterium]|nr:hypothetical protein [Lentimicrobiaceae bacterium]